MYFPFNLSILSSHSFSSQICSEYLSGTSNDYAECSVAGIAEHLLLGALSALWLGLLHVLGVHCWLLFSVCCYPNLFHVLPHFYRWGNVVPMSITSVTCFGVTITPGIAAIWGGVSVLMMGVAAGVGEIGQSFLVSNKFYEADPVLDQGVPCLIGHWIYLPVVDSRNLG